eukprot:TRINITY_DN1139_c0_g1_i1.p1 TRINITY_DN1139_c0_g1~~TRINITY_DN1139_c0_g1_i1.p1  ORF type:complete len:309 (-),score=98.37 TRINITY_DN1139_c0_g1_i1:125-1051(-)
MFSSNWKEAGQSEIVINVNLIAWEGDTKEEKMETGDSTSNSGTSTTSTTSTTCTPAITTVAATTADCVTTTTTTTMATPTTIKGDPAAQATEKGDQPLEDVKMATENGEATAIATGTATEEVSASAPTGEVPAGHKAVPFECFYSLLQFLYTDHLEVKSIEEALDLISLSRYYFLDTLEDRCISKICTYISSDNVCYIWNANELELHSETLSDFCLKFFVKHFLDVALSDGFLTLNGDLLKSVLTPGMLEVEANIILWHLSRWAKANAKEGEDWRKKIEEFKPPHTLFNHKNKMALLEGVSLKQLFLY